MNDVVTCSYKEFPSHVERWSVLRTRPRWEKQVAGNLADIGMPVYLPLMSRVTAYKGKTQAFDVPLFSGYVFCGDDDFFRNPAISPVCRRRVTQVLRPTDHRKLLEELHEISEVVSSRRLIQERVFGKPGDIVRVVGGPFKGTEGVLRRLNPEKRILVLEISFLGTRVEVDVEEHMVARV